MSTWSLASGVMLALDTVESTNTIDAIATDIDTILSRVDVAVSTRLATSGYTAPDNTSVTAIKAKTDSLTFTVAGQVDANTKSIQGSTITGSGTEADPWGP